MKSDISDLAIFSGSPLFHEQLHVGRPNLGDRAKFLERVNTLLDRNWLTNNGPYVQELETRLAEFLDVKHCVLVCNGTVGLEIAIRATELTGEVIVPSFTFVATAHALQWQGITPIFCDIASNSHHIDPHAIEKHISSRTTAILGVHVWGVPCDTKAIESIAKAYDIKVLYDAAHAFACSHEGSMIGTFGDAEIFSFHATKFFNTFEGGAVTTQNDELAERMRYMRNFGFSGYDQVDYVGVNGKMSEISAAMGLSLLDDLDHIIATNKRNYHTYQDELNDIEGITLYPYKPQGLFNYQYIIVEVDEALTSLSRDTLVHILHSENILARRYFYPGCHEMEPYRSLYPVAGVLLENTNQLTRRVMSLPTGTSISTSDIGIICDLIRFSVENATKINQSFANENK